ncbi:PREDICTED: DDT domain-containing protein DDB_G0282237-like [Camelina sativa]|uniref:DDT domain-containing protein DDB_G0282237-like n=1 Tax=Camelina sativa TaxID=90675 RepID=A0ABM0ZA98_CAMSA|nr:PREDICTED: DDT domain-containing protein DDB_G0282237-like [Camelina sativa]
MDVVESFGHGDDDFGSGSACSTPFVSAPSSPGRGPPPPGYFFSAPSSPMHFFLCSASSSSSENPKKLNNSSSCGDFEFDFSSRLSSSSGPSMTSAEELFSNGQIKPMKLSSHLQRPQILSPLLDLENEEEEDDDDDDDEDAKKPDGEMKRGRDLKLRSRSVHRKARSLSPLRRQWNQEDEEEEERVVGESEVKECIIRKLQEDENVPSAETTPSCSASSSRSSSYGRNSKKWIFLKDLLHRSKSEGRGNAKEKFWSNISFSPSNFKDKKLKSPQPAAAEEKPIQETVVDESKKQKQKQQPPAKKTPTVGKPTNGIAKRRGSQPSAHELHYTTNRAQAEEMKKRTYLPYRHGLFGCLGFSSKGYSALNGLARSLNPVSSG